MTDKNKNTDNEFVDHLLQFIKEITPIIIEKIALTSGRSSITNIKHEIIKIKKYCRKLKKQQKIYGYIIIFLIVWNIILTYLLLNSEKFNF